MRLLAIALLALPCCAAYAPPSSTIVVHVDDALAGSAVEEAASRWATEGGPSLEVVRAPRAWMEDRARHAPPRELFVGASEVDVVEGNPLRVRSRCFAAMWLRPSPRAAEDASALLELAIGPPGDLAEACR